VPTDLASMVKAPGTALCLMELQRGVCGDLAGPLMQELAAATVESELVGRVAALTGAARSAGVTVVHCTAEFRKDRRDTPVNAPLVAVLLRDPDHLIEGTPAVEVLPELGPEPGDLVISRHHGVSPFIGTSLDMALRACGVSTVVAAGVSVNLGILGLVIEAVNLGYRVVLPTDAVAGFPAAYATEVIERTLSLVATRTSVAELMAAWA
jgi:nicotinamidase-related amidase